MNKEDIEKCHFVPLSSLKKALEFLETNKIRWPDSRCKRDFLQLQRDKCLFTHFSKRFRWATHFHRAMHRAIYSHDWDKLLYLLMKSPVWEHKDVNLEMLEYYKRAVTILLMYHPDAKSLSLLDEYFHMVLSCRTDEEKKMLKKVLLTLPKKFQQRVRRKIEKNPGEEDDYF